MESKSVNGLPSVLQDDFSILKFNQYECESVYHV